MRFRTRTQEVEAIQWTGDNLDEVEKFCHDREVVVKRAPAEYPGMLMIDGHDDGFPCPGDYIVFEPDEWLRGVQRGHKFEQGYEPVPDLIRTVADYEGLPGESILWIEESQIGAMINVSLTKLGNLFFPAGIAREFTAEQLHAQRYVCSVIRLGGEQ